MYLQWKRWNYKKNSHLPLTLLPMNLQDIYLRQNQLLLICRIHTQNLFLIFQNNIENRLSTKIEVI